LTRQDQMTIFGRKNVIKKGEKFLIALFVKL